MVEYNTPIEVTKNQYLKIARELSGICARRVDEKGKYWVSLWFCRPEWKFKLNNIVNEK